MTRHLSEDATPEGEGLTRPTRPRTPVEWQVARLGPAAPAGNVIIFFC